MKGSPEKMTDFVVVDNKLKQVKKLQIDRKKQMLSDESDEEESSSTNGSDTTEGDSSDSIGHEAKYVFLSEDELKNVDSNIKICVGKLFTDSDDGTQGKIIDIVKESSSNLLCFRYCDTLTKENEYMWAATSVGDDCITWSDEKQLTTCRAEQTTDGPLLLSEVDNIVQQQVNEEVKFNKQKNATNNKKPSYTYELVHQKNILESKILPAGLKRSRCSSSSSSNK